jgi:uncharacterized protein
MNINRICLTFVFLVIMINSFGQQEAKSKIAGIVRFKNDAIELRWLADNKTVLKLGFNNSYTIERRDSGASRFEIIATVNAFNRTAWEKSIQSETDTTEKNALETAREFLFAPTSSDQKPFSMESGIGDIGDAKSKEDMVYALFVLSTIKSGKAAEALGLRYIDKNVKPGRGYEYRISLNATSAIYQIEPALLNIKAMADINKYKNDVMVYTGDTKLSFVWASNAEINGYFVTRAVQGDVNFKPLNTKPFYDSKGPGFEGASNGAYDDDSLTNYKWYTYRFYGTTAFGEKVLFAEVKGMPRDLTPPQAPIVKQPKHVKPRQVDVTWEMQGNIADLKGFIVGRSDKDTGDYKLLHKKILPATSRNFADTAFNTEANNYYVVYALDTAGNISASYPAYVALTDSTAPAKPIITSAIIDSLGVVTLKVIAGSEKDLKGYRLFKSNDPAHEPSVIEEAFRNDKADTSALKIVFTDTVSLNSLTSKIYYKIKALDYNYNQSPFSDVVIIKRPDTIPPVTPVFTKVVVKENEIFMQFAPSGSEDVKEQSLYRRTDSTAAWTVRMLMPKTQTQFTDTSVKTNITYYYSLRAVDESGLYSSYANAVYGKPYFSGILPDIIKPLSGMDKKRVVLTWEYPSQKQEVFFVIYKKNTSGKLVQLVRVKEKRFIDENTGKENVYAIKAIMADGSQSPLSSLLFQKAE